MVARLHQVTFGDATFQAHDGQLLLDAALQNGIELPHDCRAGHCGTCCVRLVSGEVSGGKGAEPGVIHACQCRVFGNISIEKQRLFPVQTVPGVLHSVRPAAHDILEVGVRVHRPLLHLAGQYAQLQFQGFPARPFSMTHPLRPLQGKPDPSLIWFHVRRMRDGQVTPNLGQRIRPGHQLTLSGPFGAAHFRPNQQNPLILVGTCTGFAPLWSIAVAALRENPRRKMTIVAGGRYIESLYMWPALARLSAFPRVKIVPFCSTPQNVTDMIQLGRPTEFIPPLRPDDVVYACGASAMVEAVKAIAEKSGATCHADPFLTAGATVGQQGALVRTFARLAGLASAKGAPEAPRPTTQWRGRAERSARSYGMATASVRSHYRTQGA